MVQLAKSNQNKEIMKTEKQTDEKWFKLLAKHNSVLMELAKSNS